MCGLMPRSVETSEQLHMVVGLLAGMIEESDEETKNPTTPMNKLREALSSKDSFQRHYLELSELAMGTFKHIGRIRSARLIGKDLAQFYIKLGEPQKAAAFLCDVLKTSLQENWTLLTTHIQLELVNCYKLMNDSEKCVKVCAQIASSPCIAEVIRLAHFEEMVSLSTRLKNEEKLLIFNQSFFDVEYISINCCSEIIICDSELIVTLESKSNFLKAVNCQAVSMAVHFLQEDQDRQPTIQMAATKFEHGFSKAPKLCSDWIQLKSLPPVLLEEQFDYKQDRSLTSANLLCANLQTILKRRDSQVGLHKDKDVIKDDFTSCLTVCDVVLEPGKNSLTFKFKAGKSGVYVLGQLSIETDHLEFLVPKCIPPAAFRVVSEEPKIFLQRATKGDLIAGVERELILTVQTGSKIIEPDTIIRLQASKGLLLKVDGGEDKPAFMQSIDCPLPPVGLFQSAIVKVSVLAEVISQKETNSLERKVLIVSPWSMKKQECSLVFVLPFSTIHKLQTAHNRKYVQVTVQGLQEETFELFNHRLEVIHCCDVAVVPMNPLMQYLTVCKEQNATYLWELVSDKMDDPVLHLKFSINYYHKSRLNGILADSDKPLMELYAHQFDISDYKTLYTIRSKVEPVGSEFCRLGSICHMNICISCIHSSSFPSLMYEVLADQMLWAVCGRTAGVVTMGTDGQHSVTLDVMPLTRGFLPLPAVRLSKYIAAEHNIGVKDSPKKVEITPSIGPQYPRLEPFNTGQVFNWTKGVQIHVLPALGTSTCESSQ